MNRILLFVAALFLVTTGFSQPSDPGSQEAAVLSVVQELFDGYRAGDSERVGATLSSTGNMQRISVKEGKSIATAPASLQEFVQYVASGLKEKHDEPLWDTKVHVDGDLASVWTKYAFYLGGKFHHCGAENFLLHKEDGKWKIFHLVDTSQTEGCIIPDEITAKSEF